MNKYKISVSKNNKRYTLVLKAESDILARKKIHEEGYSILSIEEYNQVEHDKNIFFFEGKLNGEIKRGKIIGDDIFKVFIKLSKNLGYKLNYLYNAKEENITNELKQRIINELNDEYLIFSKGEKKDGNKDKLKKELEEHKNKKINLDNFYLKKELEDTYKLIEFILEKIKKIVEENEINSIDITKKEKLKEIFNLIIKLKKTTNINKLKEIGEIALIKIGKIELEELEKTKNKEIKGELNNTNKLLKKIGSKKSFIEKDKDINYIIGNIIGNIEEFFLYYINEFKGKKEVLDKTSHAYIKNMLYLNKYQEKLKLNNKEILKNIHIILFNTEKRKTLFIKRAVIKQNITLFNMKLKGVKFSYTIFKKGYTKIIRHILLFIKVLREYFFSIVVIYSILFIIILNTDYYIHFNNSNFDGIFYFILFFFSYILLYLTRNLFTIFFNFVIFFFIIIFGLINF